MSKLLCCSIIKREIEFLIKKHGIMVKPTYIDCTLHVFPERLSAEINSHLCGRGQVIVYGNKCCANMEQLAAENYAVIIGAENCVEMILGPEVSGQIQFKRAFFLTTGWFENWDLIIKKTLNWDRVTARLNFGYCDQILIIDTGLIDMPDLKILEIFDYTGLPVTFYKANLDHLERLLLGALEKTVL